MNQYSLWDINTAGWCRDASGPGIMLVPSDIDAELTIGQFYLGGSLFTHDETERLTCQGAPPNVERFAVSCGEFSGWTAEYHEASAEGETFWRVWWLFSRHVHLYVTYHCPALDSDLHRNIVDWMLGTLTNTETNALAAMSLN